MVSKELLLEFGKLAKGEWALAFLLMVGKPLPELLEIANMLEKPYSDFVGAIMGGNPEMESAVLEEAKKLLEIEYPEVYALLERMNDGSDPDIIPI